MAGPEARNENYNAVIRNRHLGNPRDDEFVVQKPLISPNVRREAREFLVGWTLREICDLFHDHGFSADYGHEPATSGERRSLVEQFYATVDWCNREHVEGDARRV